MNSSEPFLDAQEDTVYKVISDLNLLFARLQVQDLLLSMLQAWLADETPTKTHVEMQ